MKILLPLALFFTISCSNNLYEVGDCVKGIDYTFKITEVKFNSYEMKFVNNYTGVEIVMNKKVAHKALRKVECLKQ
jgi:hypothetical protein